MVWIIIILVVFKEGAKTILFYARMLPKVQISSFISGIVGALAILILIAYEGLIMQIAYISSVIIIALLIKKGGLEFQLIYHY